MVEKIKVGIAEFRWNKPGNPFAAEAIHADLQDMEVWQRAELWNKLEDLKSAARIPHAILSKIRQTLRVGNKDKEVSDQEAVLELAQAVLMQTKIYGWAVDYDPATGRGRIEMWLDPKMQKFFTDALGILARMPFGRRILRDVLEGEHLPHRILKKMMTQDPHYTDVRVTFEERAVEDTTDPGGDPAYG